MMREERVKIYDRLCGEWIKRDADFSLRHTDNARRAALFTHEQVPKTYRQDSERFELQGTGWLNPDPPIKLVLSVPTSVMKRVRAAAGAKRISCSQRIRDLMALGEQKEKENQC